MKGFTSGAGPAGGGPSRPLRGSDHRHPSGAEGPLARGADADAAASPKPGAPPS